MSELITLTAKALDNGIFRIHYDGRIMGDDRGFSSKAECIREIEKRVAIDQRDAVRFERAEIYRNGEI